jgi:hypothetical protein
MVKYNVIEQRSLAAITLPNIPNIVKLHVMKSALHKHYAINATFIEQWNNMGESLQV